MNPARQPKNGSMPMCEDEESHVGLSGNQAGRTLRQSDAFPVKAQHHTGEELGNAGVSPAAEGKQAAWNYG